MKKVPEKKIHKRNKSISKIIKTINKKKSFLFVSYLDPDALGSMMALGLVLKRLQKDVYFYISENIRLEYLQRIIEFNGIEVITDVKAINRKKDKFDCVIFNDTPNRKVVPNTQKFSNLIDKNDKIIIEIDHHFGADAGRISEKSICLFEKANANCEIITKILYKMDRDKEIRKFIIDTVFIRNVILSLITGIISDTQLGTFVVNKHQYKLIMAFLSKRLQISTVDSIKKLKNPQEIYEYMSARSEKSQICMDTLLTYIEKRKNIFLLDIADMCPAAGTIGCPGCENVQLEDVVETIANKLPEMHKKVGVLILDKNLEGEIVNYIKVRRSKNYKNFDLRTLENPFKKAFGDLYVGGGGHEGAVSFRVRKTNKQDFYERVNPVLNLIN